jgi:hypothetical protein
MSRITRAIRASAAAALWTRLIEDAGIQPE